MAVKGFIKVEGADAVKGVVPQDLFGYWELESGDTAVPLIVPRYSDKSVHIFAAPGKDYNGAIVSLEQSNDPDLAKYVRARDIYDTPISQTTDLDAKAWAIGPNSLAIKPTITGGDANTMIRVCIVGKGN